MDYPIDVVDYPIDVVDYPIDVVDYPIDVVDPNRQKEISHPTLKIENGFISWSLL
jgi:hypothetical protein